MRDANHYSTSCESDGSPPPKMNVRSVGNWEVEYTSFLNTNKIN